MSPARRTGAALGATAVLAGLSLAGPATAGAAAFDTTSSSASTITLDSAFRSALRAQGVRLVA